MVTPALKVSVLSPCEVDADAGVREAWERRVEASNSLYKLYQSPLWWEHVRATDGDQVLKLVVIRDAEGTIRALAPCALTSHTSVHAVAGRVVTVLNARGVELLGSEPLADAAPEVLDALYGAVCSAIPGATICRLKSLPAHSPSWDFLTGTSQRARPFFVKTAGPKRLFYSIEMGESWTSYLARFTGKQRNDLKRKQRLLSEAAKGELQVKRISSEDLIREMYGDLKQCFDDAWQRTGKTLPSLAHLEDAARRKFLRTYLLYAGDTAIAYAIGYQSHGVFHYSDVGFSLKYIKWSPGTVLLFLITRDLADHEPVHWVNFGIGSAEYKRRFSNVTTEDSTVYVMRRTVRNRLRAVALDLVAWAWQVKAKRKAAAAAAAASAAASGPPAPQEAADAPAGQRVLDAE